MLKDKGHTGIFQDSASGSSFNVKILVTLADEERCVRPQELVAEDLGQEDVVGLVLGLEPVAADGSVGASEVARFPGLVQGTEGVGNVLGQLGAGGGVDGIGAGEGFHGAEVLQGPDDEAWLRQDRDRVGLEAGACRVLSWPLKSQTARQMFGRRANPANAGYRQLGN